MSLSLSRWFSSALSFTLLHAVSALWGQQIGQEWASVDVSRVKSGKTIAMEVIKYALKGSELVDCPDPIAPLLRAIKGTRLLAGWGSMHPMPQLDEEEGPVLECETCKETKSYLPAEIVTFMSRTVSRTSEADAIPQYRAKA